MPIRAKRWTRAQYERAIDRGRRDPGPLAPPERGHGYRAIETLRAPSVLSPLAAPAARISVADLLP